MEEKNSNYIHRTCSHAHTNVSKSLCSHFFFDFDKNVIAYNNSKRKIETVNLKCSRSSDCIMAIGKIATQPSMGC